MIRYSILFFSITTLLLFSCKTETKQKISEEEQRWQDHSLNTTIIRDDFGVPHIYEMILIVWNKIIYGLLDD